MRLLPVCYSLLSDFTRFTKTDKPPLRYQQLDLGHVLRLVMAKQNNNSGWDPVLIISQVIRATEYFRYLCLRDNQQIISLQALHYLVLSMMVSPLLALFAESSSLEYEGGAANVGMHTTYQLHCSLMALSSLSRHDYGLEANGRTSDHRCFIR